LEIAEKLNSENDRLYAFMGMGESYLAQNDFRLSEQYLFMALHLANHLRLRDEKKQLYFDLSQLYLARQELPKVVQYQNLYMNLKDSLFTESKSKQIHELTIKYEAEKKENEIKLLNKDNLLQRLEVNKARMLRDISLAGTVLLLTIAVFLFYHFRQRVRANRLLTEQKQELQDLNTIKTKLFSAISHDLRSPLTSLHGLLQIMEEQNTSGNLKPFMNHANLMMSNTMTLLDNLLYWSARQVKGIPIQFTKVSLFQVAEENISLFSTTAKIKQIKLSHHISDQEWVFADVSSVHFVFRNLISNALKFTKANGEISISSMRINQQIEISIMDTGVGIAASVRVLLFNYSNGSTHGTENEKGTGLGLVLCKEFIEKNGGKIWLDSSTPSGTVFKFTLMAYNSSEESSPNRFTSFLETTKE
ncbi:MAG: sensor histidine kinase, partial [Cyclobacteriaceae bacterium]